jgi:hypothetical protein
MCIDHDRPRLCPATVIDVGSRYGDGVMHPGERFERDVALAGLFCTAAKQP